MTDNTKRITIASTGRVVDSASSCGRDCRPSEQLPHVAQTPFTQLSGQYTPPDGRCPAWTGRTSARQSTTKANILFISHLTSKLIYTAEQAYAEQSLDRLSEAATLLSDLPMAGYSGVYYSALALAGRNRAQARKLLVEVAERAAPVYRAKALVALGTANYTAGDFDSASRLYKEAGRLNVSADPLLSFYGEKNAAILESVDGNHTAALSRLERLDPLARFVGQKYPAHYYDYRNSLAVELNAVGRLGEAQRAIREALASPYASRYPEWSDTATEIKTAARDTIYLSNSLPVKISARITSPSVRALMKKVLEFNRGRNKKPTREEARASPHIRLKEEAIRNDKIGQVHWQALYRMFNQFARYLPSEQVTGMAEKAFNDVLEQGGE